MEIGRFLLKKGCILLLSLWVVVTLTFFLMHAVPGDPFNHEEGMPAEILRGLYHHYGLDQPLYIQYVKYLKGLVTWNIGPSFKYEGRTVQEIINQGFPISFTLGCESLCLALGGGILFGTIAAWHYGKRADRWTMAIAILGLSIPSFIIATILQYVLAMKLGVLPVARWGTLSQSLLPAMSLAAFPMAAIARFMRTSLIEVLHQDYILTARAKGLSSLTIFWRHSLRNALIPVITYLGPLTANIITGSFAIEKIFGIPGLGQWFVISVINRDYTVILGLTVFYSFVLMLCMFFVDLLYCFLDPRIHLHGKH